MKSLMDVMKDRAAKRLNPGLPPSQPSWKSRQCKNNKNSFLTIFVKIFKNAQSWTALFRAFSSHRQPSALIGSPQWKSL